MKKISLVLSLVFLGLAQLMAQKSAFTVQDIIKVKSLGSQTLSPNGEWLAGIISDGTARFGTDHFRFRDPSYLNLRAGEPVLINTNSGDQISIFDEKARISGLTWTKEGDRLFFFEQKDSRLVLAYFDVDKGRVRYPKIKDERILTANALEVFPDGESVIIAVRNEN